MPISDEYLKKFNGVRITDEMKERALKERQKREPNIQHHFETSSYSQEHTDQILFYGEFGFRQLIGINCQDGIRPAYDTIDSNDLNVNGWTIDVKTETIPDYFFCS